MSIYDLSNSFDELVANLRANKNSLYEISGIINIALQDSNLHSDDTKKNCRIAGSDNETYDKLIKANDGEQVACNKCSTAHQLIVNALNKAGIEANLIQGIGVRSDGGRGHFYAIYSIKPGEYVLSNWGETAVKDSVIYASSLTEAMEQANRYITNVVDPGILSVSSKDGENLDYTKVTLPGMIELDKNHGMQLRKPFGSSNKDLPDGEKKHLQVGFSNNFEIGADHPIYGRYYGDSTRLNFDYTLKNPNTGYTLRTGAEINGSEVNTSLNLPDTSKGSITKDVNYAGFGSNGYLELETPNLLKGAKDRDARFFVRKDAGGYGVYTDAKIGDKTGKAVKGDGYDSFSVGVRTRAGEEIGNNIGFSSYLQERNSFNTDVYKQSVKPPRFELAGGTQIKAQTKTSTPIGNLTLSSSASAVGVTAPGYNLQHGSILANAALQNGNSTVYNDIGVDATKVTLKNRYGTDVRLIPFASLGFNQQINKTINAGANIGKIGLDPKWGWYLGASLKGTW